MTTEAPAAEAPTTTPQPPAGGAPAPVPTPPPAAGATPPANQEVDIAALQAENKRLAKEAEDARVRAKGAVAEGAKRDQLLAFAKAIGVEIPESDDKSPEALQAKLQQEIDARQTDQSALSQERQSAAIEIASLTHKVPADKAGYLNFLLQGNPAFQALDSAAPDYKSSVSALVKDLVAADPVLKAIPGGAARSGAEDLGGAGIPGEVTKEAFDKMSVMERTALYQKNPELFNRLSAA